MRAATIVLAVFSPLVASWGAPLVASAARTFVSPLEFDANLLDETHAVGDPILVCVTLGNRGVSADRQQLVVAPPAYIGRTLRLDLERDGEPLPVRVYDHQHSPGDGRVLAQALFLEPGEGWRQIVPLGFFFSLVSPGSYTLRIRYLCDENCLVTDGRVPLEELRKPVEGRSLGRGILEPWRGEISKRLAFTISNGATSDEDAARYCLKRDGRICHDADRPPVVERWPGSVLSQYFLFDMAMKSGPGEHHLEMLRSFLSRYPSSGLREIVRAELAVAMMEYGDREEGVEILRQLDKQDPCVRYALSRGRLPVSRYREEGN